MEVMNSQLPKRRTYYEVIAGLASFERSQDVSLSHPELQELVKAEFHNKQAEKLPNTTNEETKRKKVTVHGYLGGKVDLDEASNASYDLSHTLLGGYVPRRQLESLSSIDFAHYFHKSLECEDALQIYDMFVANNFRRATALPSTVTHVNNNNSSNHNEPHASSGSAVKKSLVCKKCGTKFSGSHRMHRLRKHDCNSKR
ncbi:hypothetical protein ZYGR_0AD01830 [Zygosaccharomyces rouxii]|uniref:ZYRO0G10186p n=2 Tax=Zygosaccharomyces rouxii TaxID=4956 RepID=C5E067_ZYGRC|nr:uncharacterized protein ZYRO0G10186g [Zygosaccharomyces rouxii]KAH9202496.1 RSC complex, Rsc14/Ldb7 subunit-domain-containing protein [Zygosaccharomyces rouxii]GAV51000.1 hypothetical protein ZYGR_0AD01830 [Zygosaccharomyces rouxii]CAR29501.1 ZYRO0G10186p [Zygosaccharomyces rouxii]